ncbi:PLP-dependent aminotransferase family protein [Roseovarius sp. A21]|uniref:PLP-dependent aminotransferase family protein n=1 Tax=Roseovarius bejariae TaxID=2576383 RepID=A0A844CXD7_9RHOB|nr:PLP-dependent aminotransferase family protein [Roseovarius bejariae]MRU15310.1 PLP-dependent aminotransferase family protein [Roseovarius bejariae]
MSHWPLSREDMKRPVFRSLAQGIAAAIGAGALRPGDRLPTHRELAWSLGISVQTVSRAYEELIRADMIAGEVGRGSFVRPGPQALDGMPWQDGATKHRTIDMSLMTPVHLPEMDAAWSASLERIAKRVPAGLVQGSRPDQVSERFTTSVCEWLTRCGLVTSGRRMTITNGVTPAMFTALSAVAKPGDVVLADTVTSHLLRPTAQALHIGLRAVPSDANGMCPDALRETARKAPGAVKAVYLLPDGAGPDPRILDKTRRHALAQVAEDTDLMILECDPLGPLEPRRPPPIVTIAPERTFYCTGMAKCLSPGLRIGILISPGSKFELTVNRHTAMSWMATPLIAEIAADWIESGDADRVLDAQRAELQARNRLASRILGPRSHGNLYGLHRWLPLPEGTQEGAVVKSLLDQGIAVAPGERFALTEMPPAIRICLGGAARHQVEYALHEISAVISSPERPSNSDESGTSVKLS